MSYSENRIPSSLIFQNVSSMNLQEYQAQISLTRGIVLTHNKDQLLKRLQEDEQFKKSFYEAISVPPASEIQVSLAEKIVQVLPSQDYPDWVKEVQARLSEYPLIQREHEQAFLKQCAEGSLTSLPTDLDVANVRDAEGRTGLHLALMNPSTVPSVLRIMLSHPQLIALSDYDQNYPLDLVKNPSFEFLTDLLLAVSDSHDSEVCNIVREYLTAHLKNSKEITPFLEQLAGKTDRASLYASPARAAILMEVLLDNYANCLESFSYILARLLEPGDLKQFVERWGWSSQPVYEFFLAWAFDQDRMPAKECMEILKFFAANIKLCTPMSIFSGDVVDLCLQLTTISNGCEILDFMLKTYPISNLQMKEFCSKLVSSGVNLNEAEKVAIVLLKHDKFASTNPDTVFNEIMRSFPQSGAEILQIIAPKLKDETIIYYLEAGNYVNNSKKCLDILIAEIKRRASARQICLQLTKKALYLSERPVSNDEYDYFHLRINDRLLELLLSGEFVFPKAEMIQLVNEVIRLMKRFDTVPIQKVNIEQLKILVSHDLDLVSLFNESAFRELLHQGKALKNVEWILLHVLKKLSLESVEAYPPSVKSSKILEKMFNEVIQNLPKASTDILISYPSKFQEGFSYDIEPDHQAKTIKVTYRKQDSQEKVTLFRGYITYGQLIETIRQHDQSKADELVINRLQSTYASNIVGAEVDVEFQDMMVHKNKNWALKIDKNNRKVRAYLPIPGKLSLKIHELDFDQLLKTPSTIDKLLENLKKEVESLVNTLQQQIGKENCLFSLSNVRIRTHLTTFLIVLPNGLVYFVNSLNPERRVKLKLMDSDKAVEEFKIATRDIENIREFVKWAKEKQGGLLQGRASMLSSCFTYLFSSLEQKNWVCMPWAGGGFWLFTKDIISGQMLCSPAWDIKDKDKSLKGLMDIQEVLGGHVGNKEQLNALIKSSVKKLHNQPAKVSLNDFLSVFDRIKNQEWFIEQVSKERTTVESLESNLRFFIGCVSAKKGISGWEDTVKHRQDYLDLEIYLTNTLEELQKRQDEQGLNQLVMEIAKHGRYCGNKVSELCYQNYALTFGISNMESDTDDLDDVLRSSYKQAFLETLELLVKFVGDPEAKCQSTHVLSYLRSTLSDLGYQVPEDPSLAPHQQDGKNDRFHENWGAKDYPKDILEEIFPAICLPTFIQKFSHAQEELLKNQKWQTLGSLRQVLSGRIEMGLEGRISLPIEPSILREYSRLMQVRQEKIKQPKESVAAVEVKLRELDEKQFICLKEAGLLESSLINLSTKISEISEECLALVRRKNQIGDRLKSLSALSQNPVEIPATRKRMNSGSPSADEQKLQNQLIVITKQQALAEKSQVEVKKQREAIQTILKDSSQLSSILGEREKLKNELEKRKKECADVLQDKSDLCKIVEELCDKDGYLCETPICLSVLSLKGLLQVLLQKNLLIQSDNLQRQLSEASALPLKA